MFGINIHLLIINFTRTHSDFTAQHKKMIFLILEITLKIKKWLFQNERSFLMQLVFVFLNLIILTYCHCSAVVGHPFCMRKVCGSNPLEVKVFFLLSHGVPRFKSWPKLQFYNSLQQTCHQPQGAFMAILNNPRGVGSSGKRRKLA